MEYVMSRRAGAISLWAIGAAALMTGCASGPTSSNLGFEHDLGVPPGDKRPVMNASQLAGKEPAYDGRLPLGLGARFNLYLTDTIHDAETFYDEVLEPRRSGTVFRAAPYALDYAVLDSGDAYSHSPKLSKVNIRSDYDIRVGMSRRFSRFSDFFKTGFWLAEGEHGPAPMHGAKPGRAGWSPFELDGFSLPPDSQPAPLTPGNWMPTSTQSARLK